MKHRTSLSIPHDDMTRNMFDSESDECDEEEFLQEEFIKQMIGKANDLPKSGDPYFDEQAYKIIECALSLTEKVEMKELMYSMTYHHKITLGNRTSLNEECENKKRKFSIIDHLEDTTNVMEMKKRKIRQPFKSRRDMVNPKLLFQRVVRGIAKDYRADTNFTPGALSLLQQVSENAVVEVSNLTYEIAKFLMLSDNIVSEKHFHCGYILHLGGKPLSNMKLQFEDLHDHFRALNFIRDNSTPSLNGILFRMHEELVFLSFCDEDCDYYMEEEDEKDNLEEEFKF
ncbi:hypothetical protein FDP41_002939 [Naegleria fowleri]|nr:uncharacterized protein FDP41_002939 [Naegleria fowleri]KAF0978047.1 hypothetical protein FDP41_002939 [Naegleria fowleri]CAG4711602.1 unnamed protein product [Naegleria fowleri]